MSLRMGFSHSAVPLAVLSTRAFGLEKMNADPKYTTWYLYTSTPHVYTHDTYVQDCPSRVKCRGTPEKLMRFCNTSFVTITA